MSTDYHLTCATCDPAGNDGYREANAAKKRIVDRMMGQIRDPSVDMGSLAPDPYFPLDAGIRSAIDRRDAATSSVIAERFTSWIIIANRQRITLVMNRYP